MLYAIVNVDGWLLFKEAICSQNRKDIHYEIEHAKIIENYQLLQRLSYPELRLLSIRPATEGIPYRDQASTLLAEI